MAELVLLSYGKRSGSGQSKMNQSSALSGDSKGYGIATESTLRSVCEVLASYYVVVNGKRRR